MVPLAAGELEQSADDCSKGATISEVVLVEELPASGVPIAARPKSPWGAPKSFVAEPLHSSAMPTAAKAYEESPLVPIGSTCLAAEDVGANATHVSTERGTVAAAATLAIEPSPTLSWEEQAEEARRLQVAAPLCLERLSSYFYSSTLTLLNCTILYCTILHHPALQHLALHHPALDHSPLNRRSSGSSEVATSRGSS